MAFVDSASAADPVVESAYDWTGFYAGVLAGVAFTDSNEGVDVNGYNSLGEVVDLDSETDFIGGATLGYNFQANQIVFGIEADASYLGYESSNNSAFFGGDTEYSAQADWLGTVRARAGLAFDNSLIFVAGGLAISDLEYSVDDDSIAPPGTNAINASKDRSLGWTIGGGFEQAFADNMSFKVEYLYVDFAGGTASGIADVGGLAFDFDFDDTQIHVVRAGLNWSF